MHRCQGNRQAGREEILDLKKRRAERCIPFPVDDSAGKPVATEENQVFWEFLYGLKLGRCKTGWKENNNIIPTWKILMKDVDLGEPMSIFDHVYLGGTQRECQISKDIVDNCRNMFESRISRGALENYQFLRNRMRIFLHGSMTGKVVQRNEWKDIVNWQTKRRNNFSKSQHHALTTTNSKKKKRDLLENCLKFAHRLF